MNLEDLIKLAGVAKSPYDTPVQEQLPSESDGMRTLIALVTPEQLNQLQGDAPVAEEMPGEATTEPDPQPYEGPLGSPADLSLRRYLGANGQPVNVDETKVYEDHKVEDINEAWQAYKIDEKKAKPDYIDIDGDGDKEESMKKAAKDKKAKADESVEEAKVEEEPNEGNAFTGAMAGKKKGEKFTVGDKTFTKEQQRLAKLAGVQVDEGMEKDEVMAIMMKHPEEVAKMKQMGDLDSGSELYMDLYSYYLDSGEMPYGTAKARDGDPVEFIMDRLDDLGMMESTEESVNEGGMKQAQIEVEDWANKYNEYLGVNGDELANGYLQAMMNTGIMSDAFDQDEYIAFNKKNGYENDGDWDEDDHDKFMMASPITKGMFDEIRAIQDKYGIDVKGVNDIMGYFESVDRLKSLAGV